MTSESEPDKEKREKWCGILQYGFFFVILQRIIDVELYMTVFENESYHCVRLRANVQMTEWTQTEA